MKQAFRLPAGGDIDRSTTLRFTFNGQAYEGHPGDSLASALLANGVHFVSRSFKYHRPRGIFTAGEEEPNALLDIGTGSSRVPSCRAPQVPLVEGLVAHSQSGWPGLRLDFARIFDYTHRLWPAGFYNKTFKWPGWHTWEGMIRKLSGLGRAPDLPDPDHYEQVNAHCDLLICGGGPAGLVAALVAGRAGLRVVLADQDEQFGGTLLRERIQLNGHAARDWVAETLAELARMPEVILLPRTTVAGNYDHNVTTLLQRAAVGQAGDPLGEGGGDDCGGAWRECLWTVRPKRIALATGAIEQGLIFPNNDRPGILLASAIRHYLNRYAVAAGSKAVIACNNDSAWQTALDLAAHGVQIMAVVDNRVEVPAPIALQMQQLGIPVYAGCRVSNTRGGRRIRSISIETLQGAAKGTVACDLLGVSGGWAPRVHLLCHARGTLKFDHLSQSFLPNRLPAGFAVMGSAAGIADLGEILATAASSARELCEDLGFTTQAVYPPQITGDIIASPCAASAKPEPCKRRQWIDLAHDVTYADAELAVQEGYESVEHFKRYTTTGMSVDQGKTGNINAFLVLSALSGKAIEDIGTTTFRPPYMPVTLGALAGRSQGDFYAPRRFLPAHRVHARLEAHFADYGGLQRPEYYAHKGETPQSAIHREVLAVRNRVGVFDNSPIGKIEVRGPHAAEFLHRIYCNNVHSLPVGSVRYGLMLNENGVIIDDGVFVRLAADHFLVNTTSAGLSRIMGLFEEWLQCEWTDLQVLADDVTSQWANFTFAGPNARSLLQSLGTDIDLQAGALPHMAATTGLLAGLEARIVRVSFSGESSFEVNVAANRANHFLAKAIEAGRSFGLTPYGIEALMILRLEKGYLHVGSDTDGATTPDDVGWGQVARNKQSDYVGKRSLYRPANLDPQRKQLVGLLATDPAQVMRPGAHLLLGKNRQAPALTDGWITSAGFSPTMGRFIALGMMRGGREHSGALLSVIDQEQRYEARIVPATFYDPENARLKT